MAETYAAEDCWELLLIKVSNSIPYTEILIRATNKRKTGLEL